MRDLLWPAVAHVNGFVLTVMAHTRAGEGRGGHYGVERAPGAAWRGGFEVVALASAEALAFRAFLHGLRGRGGTFLFRLPVRVPAAALPANPVPRSDGLTRFSDGTDFSDGTAFADAYTGGDATVSSGALAAAAAAGAEAIAVDAGLAASVHLAVGAYAVVGQFPAAAQLVRIAAIAGAVLTLRPRLRLAFPAGTPVAIGQVTARFRLDEETPRLALLPGRYSAPLTIKIAEAY